MKCALLLAVLLGTLTLPACGKKGPPTAPGPQNEITYPRSYPTF
jgi:predicted small lipoprotein YifL